MWKNRGQTALFQGLRALLIYIRQGTNVTKDMTVGNPVKLILSFSAPLLVGNLFQQLYNAVDSLIVGNFIGGEALAAAKKRYNKAALAYEEALENKKVFESEKAIRSANSLAEAKINGYCTLNKKLCAARAEAESAEGEKKTRLCAEIAELEGASAKMRAEAIDAAISRNETVPINEKIIEEVKAARAARRAAEKKN